MTASPSPPFPEPSLVALAGRHWYPVYTQPLREHRLAEWLLEKEIPFYLPLKKKFTIKRVKRPVKVDVYQYETFTPMFKGYLFAALDAEELTNIWHSNHIIRILRDAEQAQKRLLHELQVIRQFECASAELPVEVLPELVNGSWFVILNGPLQGVHGQVIERRKKLLFAVNLDMFGQSVTAELDVTKYRIEPVVP
ncbi:MAG: hypothetical protein IJJ26_03725 [Victivallales bacterium]|nr:hypothetical protein [Victivallales bacterium]